MNSPETTQISLLYSRVILYNVKMRCTYIDDWMFYVIYIYVFIQIWHLIWFPNPGEEFYGHHPKSSRSELEWGVWSIRVESRERRTSLSGTQSSSQDRSVLSVFRKTEGIGNGTTYWLNTHCFGQDEQSHLTQCKETCILPPEWWGKN